VFNEKIKNYRHNPRKGLWEKFGIFEFEKFKFKVNLNVVI